MIDGSDVICWGYDYGQLSAPPLSNPVHIAAGNSHVCIKDDNGVTCWGRFFDIDFSPPEMSGVKHFDVGSSNVCAIDSELIRCWGANTNDCITGSIPDIENPLLLAVGQESACVISRSELECWGIDTNSYYGFVVNQIPEVNEPVLIAHSKSAQLGLDHACVLSFSGGVTCWGAGSQAALYKTEVPPNLNFDPDRDGHAAPHDAFPLDATEWLDTDRDGVGSNADYDDDGDAMSDELELANGLNPLDSEDCPRWYCGNSPVAIIAVTSAAFDIDGDGLTKAQEESAGTNWRVADSDGDSLIDGDEVSRSSNPLSSDSDGDGFSDSREVELGTSPILADSDGDSMSDSEEIAEGLSPTDGSDCPRWYCGGLNLPAIIGTGTN